MTQQLTPGRAGGTTGDGEPSPPATGAATDVPQLATGVDLIGEYQASGYKRPPCLVRRGDGQTIQLTPLLYGTLELVDGRRDVSEIAEALAERTGKPVSPDNVRHLVAEKLRPPGLLKTADGRDPDVKKSNPLLSLRMRLEVTNERWTNRLSAPFALLFNPVIVLAVLAGFVATVVWVLGFEGVGVGARELLYSPGLMLATFALMILSAGFHELGHAAGCRHSGGRPGVMGCGLYLVWPAFYTDVTDAYRLDRAGRLRTDLGGLYFNAIFAVATFGAWAVTGVDALLPVIPLQLLQMAHQLLPFVRLDGYHILSDLVGVPDLFARIKPTLLALVPGRHAREKANVLKPWVRVVVVLWVLTVVPLLVFSLFTVVVSAPRVVATAWDSVGLQWGAVSRSFGDGAWATGAVGLLGVGAVILPIAGSAYALGRFSRKTSSWAWTGAGNVRFGRPGLGLVAIAGVAGMAFTLWPNGDYRPIQPGERGTITDAVRAVSAVGSGRPGLTPAREAELGGAPARAWTVGKAEPAVSTTVPAVVKDDDGSPATTVRPASSTTAPSTTTTSVVRSTTTTRSSSVPTTTITP